ncbi:hypothetical protein LZ30DRAFT_725032 [Colletotrichum cereale]|nr:hypothetical protein LZ30DRAFT_725032 [Colletotrichum cereale]
MLLLRLFTCFAVAAALVIPPPPASTGIQARGRANRYKPPLERAWDSIKDLFTTGRPEHNTNYYFMSCTRPGPNDHNSPEAATRFAVEKVGCRHVGLVIGKTASRKREFEAVYIDLTIAAGGVLDDQGNVVNTKLIPDYTLWYGPKDNQWIRYIGKTTDRQANLRRLWDLAQRWVLEAGDGKALTVTYNCLTFYQYLAGALR